MNDDDRQLTPEMREVHELCERHFDIVGAGLLENLIDKAERRTWFLFEATGGAWWIEWIDKPLSIQLANPRRFI